MEKIILMQELVFAYKNLLDVLNGYQSLNSSSRIYLLNVYRSVRHPEESWTAIYNHLKTICKGENLLSFAFEYCQKLQKVCNYARRLIGINAFSDIEEAFNFLKKSFEKNLSQSQIVNSAL